MKPSESVELVSFLRAAFPAINDEQEKVYARLLEKEPDAQAASDAILGGVKTWNPGGFGNFTPSYAQIREAIRIEKEQARLAQPRPPEPKGGPMSFWVRRWTCARFLFPRFGRDQDMRPFPQQFPHGAPPDIELMPEDEWAEEANTIDMTEAWKTIRANIGGSA